MMPSKLGKSRYYSILLCPALKVSLFVHASHPVWCSKPSIETRIVHGGSNARLKKGCNMVLAKLQDHCCKQLI